MGCSTMHRILHLPPDLYELAKTSNESEGDETPGEPTQAQENGRATSSFAEDEVFKRLREISAKSTLTRL